MTAKAADEHLLSLQVRIGYLFQRTAFLTTAMTHKSYVAEHKDAQHNERMEFLGDAILGSVVSNDLYKSYEEADEGVLSKMKARVVNGRTLARVARRLELGQHLQLGKGEQATGRSKPSLLANALEALIAAIYLDGGEGPARRFILEWFRDEVVPGERLETVQDHKTTLQERCQKRFGSLPAYHVLRERGQAHNRTFEMQVVIKGRVYGIGEGQSKKEAAQAAARIALARFEEEHTP